MKKIIAIISCVVLLVGATALYLTYSYYNPEITMTYGSPEQTDKFVGRISFAYKEKFGFSIPKSVHEKFVEFGEKNQEVFSDLQNNYIAPTKVVPSFEEKDGKTIVTYSGTATPKGTTSTADYKKEIVFDFILSRDLENKKPS